jgi:hypothetical protein
MTGAQHEELRQHLFPGDGKESVALLLCGRRAGKDRHVLTVREVHPVPKEACAARTEMRVTWPTDFLEPLLNRAHGKGQAIVKAHSHPGGFWGFSEADDASDAEVLPRVADWLGDELPHGSIVMVQSGEMFGRVFAGDAFADIDDVLVAGDDIRIFRQGAQPASASSLRHAQLFGKGTTSLLRNLAIAVVGCSGTGSIVVEQLARLGVGKLVLVDPDVVEEKNLNRILNTGKEDAYLGRPKVEVLASAIARMGLDQRVVPIRSSLDDRRAALAVAECDAVFGCMDGTEGRHLLNRLASFYLLPYVDVGVRLEADGKGGIDAVAGAVHYLKPGGSSLLSRGLYRMADVEAEELKRTNRAMYQQQLDEGYIRGVAEDRPAVISVNMLLAAAAVNEFLARLHPYRNLPNGSFAAVGVNLAEVEFLPEADGAADPRLLRLLGRGDVEPLLQRPSLSLR